MPLSFSKLFAANVIDNVAPETLITVPTSPSSSTLRNCRIRFANTTAAPITIKVWGVPAGGTAVDGNVCWPDAAIGAKLSVDIDIPVLAAGDFVQAQAGAAGITASMLDGFIQT